MANSTYVLCFSSIGSPQCVVWCFPIIFVASVLNRSIQNSILSVDLLDRKITLKKQATAKQKTPANEKTVLGAAKKIRSLPAITACIPYSFRLIAWSGYWHWPAYVKFMLKKCPYSKPQYEKFHWLRLPKLCQRISFNSWSKPKCNAKCFVPLSILHKKRLWQHEKFDNTSLPCNKGSVISGEGRGNKTWGWPLNLRVGLRKNLQCNTNSNNSNNQHQQQPRQQQTTNQPRQQAKTNQTSNHQATKPTTYNQPNQHQTNTINFWTV